MPPIPPPAPPSAPAGEQGRQITRADAVRLANEYVRRGRLTEAEHIYRSILKIAPNDADVLGNLGVVLRRSGRPQEAVQIHRRALELRPQVPGFLFNFGRSLAAAGDVERALTMFRQTIAAAPEHLQAHLATAAILVERQLAGEADVLLERARTLPEGERAPARLNLLGRVRLMQGRAEEAVAAFQEALSLRPRDLGYLNNLAVANKHLGRRDEAAQVLHRIIAVAPRTTAAYRALSDFTRYTPDHPDIPRMKALLDEPGLTDSERADLEFALGKAFDDLGNHETSFAHYRRGNALHRRAVRFSVADHAALIDDIRRVFDADALVRMRAAGLGDPTARPVFIVGMPRSGTTLTEQIISSHPDAFGAGELEFIHRAAIRLTERRSGQPPAHPPFPAWVPQAERQEPHIFARLAGEYQSEVNRLLDLGGASAAVRVTDKMPVNFRYIGLIHVLFPNARIIHCRRDPLDTCVSCFTKRFTTGNGFAFDLRELGAYYRLYETMMAHWQAVLPPGVMIDSVYEDTVADLEPQVRRLLDHVGLAFDPACLEFHKTRRSVATASASQVRKPIYTSSIGAWRRYEPWLGPLQEALAGR